MDKKILLSTHTDLDAMGIIILTKYFNIDVEDIWMNNYTDFEDGSYPYNELTNYDSIWYFDFTPDSKARQIIQENNIECIIGDHHEGIKEEIELWNYDKKTYIFDNNISGTKIYYQFLLKNYSIISNNVASEFVDLVSTYDLYDKASPIWVKAQDLNRLLYKTASYMKNGIDKYQVFIDCVMHKLECLDSFEYNKIELKKIQEDKKKEEGIFFEFTSGKRRIKTRKDSKGYHFSLIKLNSKISAIASLLLDKYKKLDYVLVLNNYDPENLKISIRSKDHINLLDFENVKGHKNAAGYENVTEDIFNGLWEGKIFGLTYKDKCDTLDN